MAKPSKFVMPATVAIQSARPFKKPRGNWPRTGWGYGVIFDPANRVLPNDLNNGRSTRIANRRAFQLKSG